VHDPFAVLGLHASFDIDPGAVERAYLARAAAMHPDVLGDNDEAASASAQLNRAKAVLLNPEKRANALLELMGGPSKEQDKSLPPGFLAEVMELREQIEEGLERGERERWQRWGEEQRAEYAQRVRALFAAVGAGDAPGLQGIRTALNAWRYIERLIEQLDPRYTPGQPESE
jgi:molecular chaperone HscB